MKTTLPTLTQLPIPENVRGGNCARSDAARLRGQLADPTRVEFKNGALHWLSNGAVVPMDVFKDAFVVPPAGQQAARDAYVDESLTRYREARRNYKPSAEEMFEMRAAFGPGVEVVDCITGQKFRT